MYASRLGNGNGNGNGNGDTISTAERAALPCEMYVPAWAGGDLNSAVAVWTRNKLQAAPYNITNAFQLENALAKECKGGWPMWSAEQFRKKVSALVPTAQETAEAFVEELTTLAPAPPTTGPTVIPESEIPWRPSPDYPTYESYITSPPDVLAPPPPPLVSFPPTSATPSTAPESLMDKYAEQQSAATGAPYYWSESAQATMPVDSAPPEQLPAHVIQAEFPLMQQYAEQRDEAIAAEVGPEGAPPAPPEKKGAGIGTVLLLAAPLLLTAL